MKRKALILLTIIVCLSFYSAQAKTKIALQQALLKKMITAKALCNGGLELNYSVSNLIKDSLLVVIPPGWRFNSNAGKNDYQDILVTHEEILVLKPLQTKLFNIKGYCCEATLSGPIKGINYTVGKLADSSLVSLARFLNTHPNDTNTEQYSVWAISDKKETANITSKNDSSALMLRNFVSTIKGEPLPWYTLLKRVSISNTGLISDNPIRFKAVINYTVPKTCYSYCYIVNKKGQKVTEIIGKWLNASENEYNANLNVAGLQKGDYKLVLQNQQQSIFEREFKI